MASTEDRPTTVRDRLVVRKAVIPAAGMGTRFLPATKSMPKEMLPIVDKPVLQFVIEEAVASGIDDILIVTGRAKRAVENHFDFNPELEAFLASAGKRELIEQIRDIGSRARIHYIRQKLQLGLGDAIRLGRDHVGDQPFAVLLGDTIIEPPEGQKPGLRQLLDVFEVKQASAVAVHQVARECAGIGPQPQNTGPQRPVLGGELVDVESAVLLAKARMQEQKDLDIDELIEQLKLDKQHLFKKSTENVTAARTSGAKDRTSDGYAVLAAAARKAADSGSRRDLHEYLKTRRNYL